MQNYNPKEFEIEFRDRNRKKSDQLIEIFLAAYFLGGFILALFYDTWLVAAVVGGSCVAAYYLAKKMFSKSNVHHYVASAIVGIYTAQFIYQMHGLFEMHFFAFIGSALMITYQNWKTQIPVALVVVGHHAIFGYLQWIAYLEKLPNTVYFTQLDYMSLQTFIIHGLLATIVFFICSLWSYQMDKRTNETIENTKNILVVAQANESVSRNLEYAIMMSEGMLTEKVKFNDGDMMGEALGKIQEKLSRR